MSQIGANTLQLKRRISEKFSRENWLELGALTNTLDLIQNHHRLLRSMDWGDSDYDGHVLEVLIAILQRDQANEGRIEQYLNDTLEGGGVNISSSAESGPRVYFTPSVFTVPSSAVDRDLIAVMMPFTLEFDPVYVELHDSLAMQNLRALRVKDIWQHSTIIQDIFSLIWVSNIVICDFSTRNPNVFYETGIAHTLGKHVIPITQSADDVPFDLRHHRFVTYHNNNEGRAELARGVGERVRTLIGW